MFMESKTKIAKLYTQNELEKQFEYVNSLIEQQRIFKKKFIQYDKIL